MASTKHEKVSIHIPYDLIFNILFKLPIKSLKRFSCVTPCWVDLLENLNFMVMYQNSFISNNDLDTSIFLIEGRPPQNVEYAFMFYGERFDNKVKLEWPPSIHDDKLNVILGSIVNGIVCIYGGRMFDEKFVIDVILWNLSNNESKLIPEGYDHCLPGINVRLFYCGFGYDNFTNDYKIIRQLYFYEDSDIDDFPLSSQIYSLKSNSWKTLDFEIPHFRGNDDGFYLNGMCHWWAIKIFNEGLLRERVIISFNLSDEVYYTTRLDWSDCYDKWNKALMAMNDSIAMIRLHKGTSCFDILILGELGVMESWTKIFTIAPLPFVSYPIGVWNRGKIFFKTKDEELYWFDLSTQVSEEISRDHDFSQIAIYKESLLSIGWIST